VPVELGVFQRGKIEFAWARACLSVYTVPRLVLTTKQICGGKMQNLR
jgi:hypothetical protein